MQIDGDKQTVAPPAPDTGNPQNIEGNGGTPNATPDLTQPTAPKWMSQLPDDLKGHEGLAKYTSLGEAMKALLDGSEPKTEEGGKGSQGEPVIDYQFTKTFAEEADSDGTLAKGLTEALKGLGLSQEQAEPIYNVLVDHQNGAVETYKTKGKELCEQALQDTWGDSYDAKLAHMKRAYGKLVPEGSDLDKGLNMSGATNNPYIAQLLAEIGESISEHSPPSRSSVGSQRQQGGFLSRENESYPWAN